MYKLRTHYLSRKGVVTQTVGSNLLTLCGRWQPFTNVVDESEEKEIPTCKDCKAIHKIRMDKDNEQR